MGQQSSRATGPSPDGTSTSRRAHTPRPLSTLFRASPQHDSAVSTRHDRPAAVEGISGATAGDHAGHFSSSTTDLQHEPQSTRRRSRVTRARESLALASIFHRRVQSSAGATPSDSTDQSSRRQTGADPSLDFRPPALPPHERIPSLDIDFDSPPYLAPIAGSSRRRRSSPHPRGSAGYQNARAQANRSATMADRISSLAPDRGFRSLVRRRRSPARQEDNAAQLARMLAVAAAATAASLMGGDSEEAVQNLRSASSGIDDDDGTFDRFLQTLRSGRLAQRLGSSTTLDQPNVTGQPNGMAFFRVFRFAQSQAQQQHLQDSRQTAQPGSVTDEALAGSSTTPPDNSTNGEAPESRMVPVLMIGIRSLPETTGGDGQTAMPSFLDALTNFPAVNMNIADHATPVEIADEAASQSTLRQRRRASMGGLFTSTRDNAHRRSQALSTENPSHSRPLSEVGPSTGSSTPLTPYPPPTTPSSRPLSALSSGASTPSRRASSSSNATPQAGNLNSSTPLSNAALASRREHFRQTARTALESTAEEPQPPSPASSGSDSPPSSPRPTRARRLSESDFLRYGSGSARRNGVVEPDDSGGHRSWIIYVLGGNYPENHPILMAPSLFTDSPTYEDMMLLSSMLGPVKPPVATTEDVTRAGGLFRLELVQEGDAGFLVGRPVTTAESTTPLRNDSDAAEFPSASQLALHAVQITAEQRCQVCLCTYAAGEEARRLAKCEHLFHRECIDQWLTTGRNSCPLCRRQGVEEKATPPSPPTPSSAEEAAGAMPASAGDDAADDIVAAAAAAAAADAVNEEVGRLFATAE